MDSNISSKIFGEDTINICVLGGGNIGTLLIGYLGQNSGVNVSLYTSRIDKWSDKIDVYDSSDNLKYTSILKNVSSDPKEVISNADIIISTLPSQVFPVVLKSIEDYIREGTWIGVMPGSGGVEFYCKELIEKKECVLFGFQRVHGISRIKEYGHSVYDLGKKKELFIAAWPSSEVENVCCLMESLLKIKCTMLPNYLSVTFTPSNPILHTTRLYAMFKDYEEGVYWDRNIQFYSEWNNKASEMLLACDEELQNICNAIEGLDLKEVLSLKEYYESDSIEKMTNKIRSIEAFKGIESPMIEVDGKFIPDFKSRYFLEDYQYGLCIIKGFGDVVGIKTPSIDKVLAWYEKVSNVEYYVNGKFIGKDLKDLPMPKNYGLNSAEDIVRYYSK